VKASSKASTNSDFSTSFSLAENVTKRNDSSLSNFFSNSFRLISFMPTSALLPQALKINKSDSNIKPIPKLILIFTHQLHFCSFFSVRSEEHTSELHSRFDIVCRLLLHIQNTTRY